MFDKQYINKNTFYKNKIPISIDSISISNFIGYVN